MIKNTTGQHISFIAIATADGAAVTTGTPTVYLSKDGAAQATSSNTASHLGSGVWVLDLTQAETNADHLSAVMVLTNAVNSFAQAFPVVQADFKADVSSLATATVLNNIGSAVTGNASAIAVVDTVVDAIKVVTDALPNSGALSDLATAASISALNDFDPSSQTVTTDAASRTASQADVSALAVRRLFEFPSTAATANSVSSVATVSPLIISAKKIHIHLRYSSTVDNTPDANTHREIALQPPTPVNTSTAPAEINLKTYFGSDNRYSISNEISSAEIDITSLGLEVLHGDWTIIVRDNQGMGYNQQVLGASIEFSPLPATIGDATAASQTSISSAISSLNDFDPSTDAVANVTTVGSVTSAVTTSNASDVTAIKAVTDNLPDSGALTSIATASALSTVDTVVDGIKSVTDNLPDSGALTSLATAASISGLNDFDPATQTVTTDAASRTASQADVSSLATAASISALNDFDPATQTVTTDAASRTASQADVSLLATAASISGLNDFDPTTQTVTTDAASRTASQADVSSLATAASISALNDFDPTTQTVTTDAASRAASQADVSSLATAASISSLNDFDPASDAVANVTTVGSVTNAVTTSNAADVTAIKSVTDKIDTALVQDGSVYQYTTNALENAPSGGGGGLTQADVRAAVGLASANLDTQLSTIDTVVDAVLVDTGTDIPASISALNDFDPATQTVTTDAASRTASQADVSLLATAASIASLNDFDASTDMVIVSTNNDKSGYSLSTAPPTASEIYQEFTSGTNEDVFKASGFATVNPDNASIAAIKSKTDSLTFTIANQVDANAVTGGGQPIGSGAISHTVTVNIDNVPANAVDVWVTTDESGTNVVAGTLVTNQAGQATFQLDAGSYYLWCQRSGVNFTNPTAFTVS
jgi:hypothetical protein